MADLCALDAVSLAKAIRNRELSAVEATRAAIARTDALEPVLHAFCTPTPDLALTMAARVDEAIAAGEAVGPLAGVPIGIKDLICTKGIRTMSGSPAYAEFVPEEDDIVVERAVAAGAVILGKTNVPEFGYSGVGHSPRLRDHAQPVEPAAHLGRLERRLRRGGRRRACARSLSAATAAARCASPPRIGGLFGMKASMGRVPLYPGCRDERYPGVSGWESLEHIGPMSRTVADSAP